MSHTLVIRSSRLASNHLTTAAFLSPLLSQFQQCRHASILTSLKNTDASYNKRIRRGRGPASGKGKTSGRGHKGQKQHGKVPAGFNGGQTPDEVVAGKRGFENTLGKEMAPLNISKLQQWILQGRIDPSKPISVVELVKSGCISNVRDGVKLLARKGIDEPFSTPIQIIVSRASSAAIEAVESVGGHVTTRYYSNKSLSRVLKREVHPFYSSNSQALPPLGKETDITQVNDSEKQKEVARFKYRLADPASRKDLEYYRDREHRGYLSYTVPENHGPSLYFRGGGESMGKKTSRGVSNTKKEVDPVNNRLW